MSLNNQFLIPAAMQGVTIFSSSGDWGSTNNTNPPRLTVSGPASSPFVVGVGGTKMEIDADGENFAEGIWSGQEVAFGKTWDVASGGGFSELFSAIKSQKDILGDYLTKFYGDDEKYDYYRDKVGVPDVSAISNSNKEGYFFVLNNTPKQYPGGTSVAAPMWASLFIQISQALDRRIGNICPILYGKEFTQANPLNSIHDKGDVSNSLHTEDVGDTWKQQKAGTHVQD